MTQTLLGWRNEVIARSHPAANLFPLLSDDELQELASDIKANGLREPIWRDHQGIIVDGRNRWIACSLAGVDCKSLTVPDDVTSIVVFIVSLNLKRRHLNTSQRAAIAAELSNLKPGDNQHSEVGSIDLTSPPVTIVQAAKLMDVSEPSVKRARRVQRESPTGFAEVKAGTRTLGAARSDLPKSTGSSRRSRKKTAGRKSSNKAPALVVLDPPDRIVQLQSWLWTGTMRAENFPSGADAVAQAEQSGSPIDTRHLEVVLSFVADMVAAARAVRAA